MNKLSSICILLSLVACQPKQKTITESRKHAVIDSMVAVRMEEVIKQAAEDLDRRRSIEVKAKADSIVDAVNGNISAPINP